MRHHSMVAKGVAQAALFAPEIPGRDMADQAAGAALVAWGLPRVRMTGAALNTGERIAAGRGASNVAAMFDSARRLAMATEGVTRGGELALRRSRAVNDLIDSVPANVRGEVATAAGLLLFAAPRRRDRRETVPGRRVTGW